MLPPRPNSRFRHALRLIGWNVLLMVAGVALAALAGEVWFRLTTPFMTSFLPLEFVPKAGYLRPPNTEIRYTNNLDFWNVSRTNSLGFLDREPPSPGRAKATCHVSIIGDSFVEAMEVPMEDKLQVRLEELAADRLPHLDVTTSTFGLSGTGQVQQLPFYDQYARRLHPKLLVLVFFINDFRDNTPVLRRLFSRSERPGDPSVRRRPDGRLEWSFPHPLPSRSPSVAPARVSSWVVRAARKAMHYSWFARWLLSKKNALFLGTYSHTGNYHDTLEALREQPGYAALLEGWRPTTLSELRQYSHFQRRDLPLFFEDALRYTRFALAQFKQRADRDGVKLVILATQMLKTYGIHPFERLSKMAATLDIPVIDQADYILRQDADLTDAQWPHDDHWNPAGHQWAAEALLEYIEQRPDICDG